MGNGFLLQVFKELLRYMMLVAGFALPSESEGVTAYALD